MSHGAGAAYPPATRQARLSQLAQAAADAIAAGSSERAVEFAEQALREGLEHPYLLRMSAWVRWNRGNFEQGGVLLNRALALAPRDPDTIFEIGRLLIAEQRWDEALKALDDAISLSPTHFGAWSEKATVLQQRLDWQGAEQAYLRVLESKKDWLPALAGLASIAARQGRNGQARDWAQKVLALDPTNSDAACVLARVEIEEKQFDAARVRLESLLALPRLDGAQRVIALGLLGDAFDKLDQPTEAFRLYSEMNAASRLLHAPRFSEGGAVEDHFSLVERLTTSFSKPGAGKWRSLVREDAPVPVSNHIFVLSYPRSGNTLVKTILASAEGAQALEEMGTLQDADAIFLRSGTRTLDTLLSATSEEIANLRENYWNRVRGWIPNVDGKPFVDMGPFKSLRLPLIARMFPGAKVVFCRRDPCDVVLSCFTRNFRANSATFQFTNLENIARHYDAVMRLVESYLESLPLDVHMLRYESLVTDFDSETQELAKFAGLEWTEAMRRFEETARRLPSKTASMEQVRAGLFDGREKWRRYASQLEPVMPILEPWRRRYGYA